MIATVGAEIRYYDLLPEQNWEVDIASVEALIDENTALLMLNKYVSLLAPRSSTR